MIPIQYIINNLNASSAKTFQKKTWLPFLVFLLTIISINQWSKHPIGNQITGFLLYTILLGVFLFEKKRNKIPFFAPNFRVITIFLVWAIIGIVRGYFVAENYWEYKALAQNAYILLFPIIVFAFEDPQIVKKVYRFWIVWGLFFYAIYFCKQIDYISQFYLAPIFFVTCYIAILDKKKWYWLLIISFLAFMLLTYKYQDNRSQSIKSAFAIVIAIACYCKKYIPKWTIKVSWTTLLITPVILLYLGISGQFNIFESTSKEYEGKNTIEVQDASGEIRESDLSADTRSFIYREVISSAIIHDYVWQGRTPARGNDTEFFYNLADDLQKVRYEKNIKHERNSNEVNFPNIFTWLGLVGMILYAYIYIYASYLGVFKSNSFYVQMAGLVVAFYFLYGWVENMPKVDISNIVYWSFISICFSPKFRKMTDADFKQWYKGLFNK